MKHLATADFVPTSRKPIYGAKHRRIVSVPGGKWVVQEAIGRAEKEDRRIVSPWRDLSGPLDYHAAAARLS